MVTMSNERINRIVEYPYNFESMRNTAGAMEAKKKIHAAST